MQLYIQLRFGFHSYSSNSFKGLETWQIAVSFFTPIILVLIWLLRNWLIRNRKSLINGRFRQDLKPTKDNLIEAYIALAVIMLNLERVDSKQKMFFIQKHLNRYFPGNTYDVYFKLSMYIKQRNIVTHSITDWIKKNTESDFKKSNIIYFLVGIANADGEIIDKELCFIKEVNQLLDLSTSDLESVLSAFDYYHNKKRQEEQSKRDANQKGNSHSRFVDYSVILKENALKVLGLSNGASIEEIKAAYRKLAKENHPDHFINHEEAFQKMVHERFIKIQEAYEFLVKRN